MNIKLITYVCLFNLTLALVTTALVEVHNESPVNKYQQQQQLMRDNKSLTPSLFARILQRPPSGQLIAATNTSGSTALPEPNAEENEVEDDDGSDGDEGDDEDEDEEEDGDESDDEEEVETDAGTFETLQKGVKQMNAPDGKILTDVFGNQIKLENNRTLMVSQNKARDLGLLTIKALVLGPLIGLTIKAALIRGVLYAVAAYALHLFFPTLLTSLGLGTGLVGFARQLQPNYSQMLMPHLTTLQSALPSSITKLASQYHQVLSPVVESIRSIPEGHCRYRAVCETAFHLIRNARSISSSLQRISASVYLNFGSDYAKAWLDGIVQSDCALKYSQCSTSPFSMVAARLAQALSARGIVPAQVAPVNPVA